MAIDTERNIRKILTLPKEMERRIKRFWHDRELRSEAEAIRRLIEIGLEQEGYPSTDEAPKTDKG